MHKLIPVRYYVLFLIFFSSSALAVSNQIMWLPDVKSLSNEACRFEMQDLVSPMRKSSDQPGQFFDLAMGASCGIYDSEDLRFEAGLDWKEANDHAAKALTDVVLGQVQLQLFDIDKKHWGLSLGAYDIGMNSGVDNFNIIYLMALHQAGAYRFGLGAYSGNSQLLLNGDGQPDYQGALIGIWKKIVNGDIGVEMQTGYNRYGYLFLGGRWVIAPKTFLVAGYGKANDTKVIRDAILVRLGFVF